MLILNNKILCPKVAIVAISGIVLVAAEFALFGPPQANQKDAQNKLSPALSVVVPLSSLDDTTTFSYQTQHDRVRRTPSSGTKNKDLLNAMASRMGNFRVDHCPHCKRETKWVRKSKLNGYAEGYQCIGCHRMMEVKCPLCGVFIRHRGQSELLDCPNCKVPEDLDLSI